MQNIYEQYRGLLFKLAYQLTGSISDAEDAVQDVFVKVHGVSPERLEEPKAYLCKMVTNRCFDLFKSARKRRERYFGPWLPEPLSTSRVDALESVVQSDLLSYAMLVLLERLSPAQRAVFVLREALCFEYPVIAELLGKSEANCRKLMSRAREKMGISEGEIVTADSLGEEWVRLFLAALEQGNIDTLLSLLAEDVVIVSDGGGKAFAAARPIVSRDLVARFLIRTSPKIHTYEGGLQVKLMSLNGQTGLVARAGVDVIAVAFMYFERAMLKNIYIVMNPDKLKHVQLYKENKVVDTNT